ncbi:hypothetical protein AVEN_29333-1 [Araneus ventricosus]|uniref:Uncharacterized protein n=1 Tax=Araneus ventricosus TaxID=182803 RepID=A0A4Y2IY10_ARAVE|nr:hypothetical protein AVEN_29333-1 [Araneus ventricosus]
MTSVAVTIHCLLLFMDTIGTGYGGWRQAIRDKFKKLRRFDQSEEVKRRKENIKISSAVLDQRGDISNSFKIVLVEQLVDQPCELNESFDTKGKESVEWKMKVGILKTKFPSLFSKLELEKEFYRVTGKLNLFQYVPKFLESYCEQLNTLLIAEKKLPAWAQTIKCMLDGSDGNVQVVKEILVLVTLPVHFSEHQLALTYPPTVTENFTEEGSASPHLGIVGLQNFMY